MGNRTCCSINVFEITTVQSPFKQILFIVKFFILYFLREFVQRNYLDFKDNLHMTFKNILIYVSLKLTAEIYQIFSV